MHRLSYLFGDLQECLDIARRALNMHGSTTSKPSPVLDIRKNGKTRRNGMAAGRVKPNGKIHPKQGNRWRILANIFGNPNMPEIDDYYEPFYLRLRSSCKKRRK
jgi:hypothetical protein